MKTQFRTSFAKDLKNIRNKDVRLRIKDAIEEIERAQSLHEIAGLKKLKAAGDYYRVRVGEYRIGLIVESDTVIFVRCLDRKEVCRYFP